MKWVILALALWPSLAWSASTGGPIFIDDCTKIINPVTNKVACFEETTPPVLKYHNGTIWKAMTGAGAGVTSITGTANQVIASAAIGPVTLSLPQSIATTSTPTFGKITITNNSNVVAPSLTLDDTRPSNASNYRFSASAKDFILVETITGRTLLWANPGTAGRVALVGANPGTGDNGGRPTASIPLEGAFTAELTGLADVTRLISLNPTDKVSVGQDSDIEFGECPWNYVTLPSGKNYCDGGAGARGTMTGHEGRDQGLTDGHLRLFTHVFGEGVGSGIMLGGLYTTNPLVRNGVLNDYGLTAGFALLRGIKANATPGDATGQLQLATTLANGTPIERARLALGFMIGTTTDSGVGLVNALNGFCTNNTCGLTTTVDVLCDTTDATKKRTLTFDGGVLTNKGTCV